MKKIVLSLAAIFLIGIALLIGLHLSSKAPAPPADLETLRATVDRFERQLSSAEIERITEGHPRALFRKIGRFSSVGRLFTESCTPEQLSRLAQTDDLPALYEQIFKMDVLIRIYTEPHSEMLERAKEGIDGSSLSAGEKEQVRHYYTWLAEHIRPDSKSRIELSKGIGKLVRGLRSIGVSNLSFPLEFLIVRGGPKTGSDSLPPETLDSYRSDIAKLGLPESELDQKLADLLLAAPGCLAPHRPFENETVAMEFIQSEINRQRGEFLTSKLKEWRLNHPTAPPPKTFDELNLELPAGDPIRGTILNADGTEFLIQVDGATVSVTDFAGKRLGTIDWR